MSGYAFHPEAFVDLEVGIMTRLGAARITSVLLVLAGCGDGAGQGTRLADPVFLAVRSLDSIRITNDTALNWTDCRAQLVGGYVMNRAFDLEPRATATIQYEEFSTRDVPVALTRADGYVRAGNGISVQCYGDDNVFHTATLQ